MPEKKKAKPDWLVQIEAAKDAEDDPVVDALAHIGNHVLDETGLLDKRIDNIETQLDDAKRQGVKQTEKLEETMNDGFGVVTERMESLRKRAVIGVGQGGATSATNPIFGLSDRLMAVIPENKRHLCVEAEREIMNSKNNGGGTPFSSSPELFAASALWFHTSMKLQLPSKFGGQQVELREQLNRYERAFSDAFPQDELMRKTTYQEGVDASGGYLVPTIIASEVLRIIQDNGVVVGRCRHIPMTSNDLRIPNEASNVSVYWADELGQTTAGEGTFGQNILTAKRLSGRATASIESIEDSVIGLIPYIQNVMAEQIARELDQEILEGDGTNFTGLVAESGVNSVATTATDGERISYLDIVNAVYAADESSVEEGCAWFMHRKVFATLVAMRVDAVSAGDEAGALLYQPSMVTGVPGSILGFPVFTTSSISAARTRGSNTTTSNVYFGNPRRMIVGDRAGLRFDVTDTGPNWEYYAVDMRLNGRWGFTVGTPAAFSKIVGGVPISEI